MRLAFALVATAACAEPAVEMKLVMPAPSTAAFDMSCITAVDLLPIPVGDAKTLDIGYREDLDMERQPCVDLDHAPTSFDDVEAMIRGRFSMALPAGGLAGVEIRGRAGSCNEMPAYHESIFYGGATYEQGQDTLAIPIAHNISCDAATSYTVRPVDLISLVQTKQCAEVTNPGSEVFSGVIRPTMLDAMTPLLFETGASFKALKPGTPSGMIGSFKSSWAGACPSVAWDDALQGAATCVNPGGANACAGTGEMDLPIVLGQYFNSSVDPTLNASYAAPVMGGVWTTTGTAGPVANATLALDAGAKAQIVYGDPGSDRFTPASSATSTTGGRSRWPRWRTA